MFTVSKEIFYKSILKSIVYSIENDTNKNDNEVINNVLTTYKNHLENLLVECIKTEISNRKNELIVPSLKNKKVKIDLLHICKNYDIETIIDIIRYIFGIEQSPYCMCIRLYKRMKKEYKKMKKYYEKNKDSINKDFLKSKKRIKTNIIGLKEVLDSANYFEWADKVTYNVFFKRGDLDYICTIKLEEFLMEFPYEKYKKLYDNYIFKINNLDGDIVLKEYNDIYKKIMNRFSYIEKNLKRRIKLNI